MELGARRHLYSFKNAGRSQDRSCDTSKGKPRPFTTFSALYLERRTPSATCMASFRSLLTRSLNRWKRFSFTYVNRYYGTRQESKIWRQKPNKKPRLSIILTQDVHKLGVKRQIVNVKHGYGRNHLLPQGMAVYATPDNIKKLDTFEVTAGSSSLNEVEYLSNFLSDKVLIVHHDPDSQSAIFEQHISRAFMRNFGIHVPLDCIELDKPVVDFDEPEKHSVTIRLDETTLVSIPVIVELIQSKKKRRQMEKEKSETEPNAVSLTS